MGYGQSTARQEGATSLRGVPASGPNRDGALDQYEYGTITALSSAGRYKAFATAFSSRPVVEMTPLRGRGTQTPILMGTPNLGSFQARMISHGGTVMCHFIAIGGR